MQLPAVSVLLPVHNAASTLAECLDSLLAQSLQDFEVIAVNDGSSDTSLQILESYARTDSRFRVFSPGFHGLVSAMNYGLAQSRSEFVARMDADDIMKPERLQLQSSYLENHPEIDLVSCRVEMFPEASILAGYREYLRWQNSCVEEADIHADMFVESPFAHPSVMFRKSAILKAGGYRDGAFPEDYELWLRLREIGMRLAKLPETLLLWRERPDRLSRTDPRYSRESFDVLRAEYLARESLVRNAGEIVFWGAGRNTRKRVRLLLERGISFSGWIDIDPAKIGKTFSGKKVHSMEWLRRVPHPLVLVYVTSHGARDQISDALNQLGYARGVDFLTVG